MGTTHVGPVALVTGGAAGIGRAAAAALARRGAAVVVADAGGAEGERTAERLRADGHEALFVAADVSRAADVEAMVDRAADAYGRLDWAFNNAGIEGATAAAGDVSEDDWEPGAGDQPEGRLALHAPRDPGDGGRRRRDRQLRLDRRDGRLPRRGPYVASKHGVVGLTRTAALEYARRHPRERDLPGDHPHGDDRPLLPRRHGRRGAARRPASRSGDGPPGRGRQRGRLAAARPRRASSPVRRSR